MPTVTLTHSDTRELQEIADTICRANSILVVTGAGISTNSGIPDFRSPAGLYNLVKSRYPNHAALVKGRDLFDSILFSDPTSTSIFYSFLAELRQKISNITTTTPTHKFIKTLSDTGRLLRCYTQNIDGLEKLDGMCMDVTKGTGKRGKGRERIGRDSGCEVVRLHGDLDRLRCTSCGILSDYTSDYMESLLSGESPECPDCSSKANDRVAAGKRSIHVGSLRPNIVLYDEPHPQAELIGRLTHHDATRSAPDLLLIFGTSLKVLGLKRLVKAFAAKIHERGGKVVYINNMPAAESTWGAVLDWHIQMDCDAWVKDLKIKRKEIWERQGLIDWKNTKPGSLKSRKSFSYEDIPDSDKENDSKVKLKRSKSTSALSGGTPRRGSKKVRQLPTPVVSPSKPRKGKSNFSVVIPVACPKTPGRKRLHDNAFETVSPLAESRHSPNKRTRLDEQVSSRAASTPRSKDRTGNQATSTPRSPAASAYSWFPSPSGTPSRRSSPLKRQYVDSSPVPPSPGAYSYIPSSPVRQPHLARDNSSFDTDNYDSDDQEFFDVASEVDEFDASLEGNNVVDQTITSSPVKEDSSYRLYVDSSRSPNMKSIYATPTRPRKRDYVPSPLGNQSPGLGLYNTPTRSRRLLNTPSRRRQNPDMQVAPSPEPEIPVNPQKTHSSPDQVFEECITRMESSTERKSNIENIEQVSYIEPLNTAHTCRTSRNKQLPTPPSSQPSPPPPPSSSSSMLSNTSDPSHLLPRKSTHIDTSLPLVPRSQNDKEMTPKAPLRVSTRKRWNTPKVEALISTLSTRNSLSSLRSPKITQIKKSNDITKIGRKSLSVLDPIIKTRAQLAKEEQDAKMALRTRGAVNKRSLGS